MMKRRFRADDRFFFVYHSGFVQRTPSFGSAKEYKQAAASNRNLPEAAATLPTYAIHPLFDERLKFSLTQQITILALLRRSPSIKLLFILFHNRIQSCRFHILDRTCKSTLVRYDSIHQR